MRVLFINSVCGIRSTGRICTDLARNCINQGDEVKIAYGREETVPEEFQKYAVRIGTKVDLQLHALRTRILDEHGFGSVKATRNFLKWAEEYDPQLLWLHNIHGYYINVEMLFAWIKSRPQMKVKWTLHDCWAFTGHCSYFTMENCSKWKSFCDKCPQKRKYPASLLKDNCKKNFTRKKAAFCGVNDMTLITPSRWLADLVKQSFLKEYPIEVQYNTIDANIFKPTPSDFRKKNGFENKKIILGVASVWDVRKGFRDFLKLSEILDERYAIVLVGLSDAQIKQCKYNMLGIQRTNSPQELAQIYTAADVFFNPTYEDNYPTVNLEAEACGTRVITYKTGGAPETIRNQNSRVVDVGDYLAVVDEMRG